MSFQKQVLLYREGDAEPTPAGGDAPPAPDPLKKLFGGGYGGEHDDDVVDDEPPAPPAPAPDPVPPVPDPAKPAEPKPSEPAPPTPPAPEPPKPAEVTYKDWKEALKAGADKYEVLKELGYDDFVVDMLKYKEQVGDLTPYLEAKTVDYTKMSDDQVLMLDLRKANPGMSEKALQFKFNQLQSEKYYSNREEYPEGSDEATVGEELRKLDAENTRKKFIEEQNKFKAPEPKPDTSQAQRDAELQQQREQISTGIMNDPAIKALKDGKVITIGEGEESFKYPITDAQPFIDAAVNFAMSQKMKEFSGVNLQKFIRSLAYAQDPDAYDQAKGKHHEAIAHKKFQAELQNVTPPPPPGAEVKEEKDLFGGGYKTR